MSVASIGGAISANCVHAAPAGLAGATAAVVAKGPAIAVSTMTLVKGALKLMAWAKIKTTAFVGATLLLATGAATIAVQQAAWDSNKLQLPLEVREQLEKQKAALKNVYLELTERSEGKLTGHDYSETHSYCAYFDGRTFSLEERLSQQEKYDNTFTFDGKNFWWHSHRNRRITKAPLAAAASVIKFRLKQWPYMHAAGVYAPEFVPEIERFSGLEPLALHYLRHGKLNEVETVGQDLQLTFEVQVPEMVVIQNMDLEAYQRDLDASPNSAEWKAAEIDRVKRVKAMKPTRTVSLLLDSKHGYAVAQRDEWNAAGQKLIHAESDDWKISETTGVWLPGRCIVTCYARPLLYVDDLSAEPVHTITYELKRVEFGKQDIPFALDARTGSPQPTNP